MKVIPKTLLPKIKSGNHGEIFYNKINELVVALGQANIIAFKENVNLKSVEDIDIDFISGKDATNTISQFVIIEKSNNVDVYNAGDPGSGSYVDITITGGLVAGEVLDFATANEGQIISGGYTIPVTPTVSGVVSAIVAAANLSSVNVTLISSNTFRITSVTPGFGGDGDVVEQQGNSVATYTFSNPTNALEGGVEPLLANMEIKLGSTIVSQGCLLSSSQLIHESNRVYSTNSSGVYSLLPTAKYVVNKVVPCNNDFFVNIYICGISLE
jgi:hypothetical protein